MRGWCTLAVPLLVACAEPEVRTPPQPLAPTQRPSTQQAAASASPPPEAGPSAAPSSSAISSAEPVAPADPKKTPEQLRDEAAALAAVEKLPEVKEYCETLKIKHGLKCIMWVSEVPEEKCGPGPARHVDACNYSVYVGEVHQTHTSRFASFYVRPGSWAVVGASDLACMEMTIANYKKLRAARLRAKPDEEVPCPGWTE